MRVLSRWNRGSYSIEAALTLTVFTICVMAVISVISIIKVEGEVQDALNQTALELSQYSYTLGTAVELNDTGSDEESSSIVEAVLAVARDSARDHAASKTAASLAETLVQKHFSRSNVNEWLEQQGVQNGYAGMDFSSSSLLADRKTISIAVQYRLKVNAYGLFDKTLTISQKAETFALLPENASDLFASGSSTSDADSGTSSIWKETNFVRGKYFLEQIRSANSGQEVATGAGIDLYDASTGHYVEAVSMNLFGSSYASNVGDTSLAGDYVPKTEAVMEQLTDYAKKMNQDLSKLDGELEMADGSTVKAVEPREKTLVVVVPVEAKENSAMLAMLEQAKREIQSDYGLTLKVLYSEEALS